MFTFQLTLIDRLIPQCVFSSSNTDGAGVIVFKSCTAEEYQVLHRSSPVCPELFHHFAFTHFLHRFLLGAIRMILRKKHEFGIFLFERV